MIDFAVGTHASNEGEPVTEGWIPSPNNECCREMVAEQTNQFQ